MDSKGLISLLAQVKSSSPGSMEALLVQTRRYLVRYLVRLTQNEGLAEDLAQESLLKINRSVKVFEGFGYVAWIKRIAFNLFVDHVRVLRNQKHDELKDIHSTAPSGALLQLEIRQGLSGLSSMEQRAILLIDHYGYSYQDAAAILGCSPDAVRCRLSRARKAFRERMAA